jgi:signal peptidase II
MRQFPLWNGMRPSTLGLVSALSALIIDQAHKLSMLFVFGWQEGERLALTPFLDHVLVWNRGISYGLFQQDTAFGQWALLGIKLAIILGLMIWMFRTPDKRLGIALGLIIGGALGNSVDRAAYGAVADFFHFHIGSFSWYVFNLADCAIVGGVALLVYDSVFPKRAALEKP